MCAPLHHASSAGATPQSVSSKYDAAHARILACLDGVKDDEWNKGVKPPGAFGVYKTMPTTKLCTRWNRLRRP